MFPRVVLMRTDTTPSNSNFVLSHRPFQNHGLSHGSKNPTASEGGVVVGDAGKPVRCYTNNSDSLTRSWDPQKKPFSKKILVFHSLRNSVYPVCYRGCLCTPDGRAILCNCWAEWCLVMYLQVPMDAWCEWTPKIRGNNVFGVQKRSMKYVFRQRDVPWSVVESAGIDTTEFRPLEVDIITNLISGHVYSEDNASALNKEGLHLLNHDSAIQRKQVCKPREIFNLKLRVQGLCRSLFTVITQRVYVDGKSRKTFANKVVSGIPATFRHKEIKERSQ